MGKETAVVNNRAAVAGGKERDASPPDPRAMRAEWVRRTQSRALEAAQAVVNAFAPVLDGSMEGQHADGSEVGVVLNSLSDTRDALLRAVHGERDAADTPSGSPASERGSDARHAVRALAGWWDVLRRLVSAGADLGEVARRHRVMGATAANLADLPGGGDGWAEAAEATFDAYFTACSVMSHGQGVAPAAVDPLQQVDAIVMRAIAATQAVVEAGEAKVAAAFWPLTSLGNGDLVDGTGGPLGELAQIVLGSLNENLEDFILAHVPETDAGTRERFDAAARGFKPVLSISVDAEEDLYIADAYFKLLAHLHETGAVAFSWQVQSARVFDVVARNLAEMASSDGTGEGTWFDGIVRDRQRYLSAFGGRVPPEFHREMAEALAAGFSALAVEGAAGDGLRGSMPFERYVRLATELPGFREAVGRDGLSGETCLLVASGLYPATLQPRACCLIVAELLAALTASGVEVAS
ncbi:MAG: hypothetical protein JWM27_70 [Gemmatimonadetes bacterium]|nr:hypothetical protein [Gemmatimonadota bacterium]